jgi:hypothetical protein
MSRKMLSFLRGKVNNKTISLTFYKGNAFFSDTLDPRFNTLRVYRYEISAFSFNDDYQEFFDGLDYRLAVIIFNGPIEPSNNHKFTFVDYDVKIGSIYAYWVAAGENEPSGPVALKVRDPEVWWPEMKLQERMELLQKQYPDLVQLNTIGHTGRNRPIKALNIGTAAAKLGLIGAVHAGESGPELIIPALENLLEHHPLLFKAVSVVAVPTLNLDMRQAMAAGNPWYLRTNCNGVDLNRNFPAEWATCDYSYGMDTSDPDAETYRGPYPGSEPETRAVMELLKQQRPSVIFSYHALASICGLSFLLPAKGQDDLSFVQRCKPLMTAYAKGMVDPLPGQELLFFGATSGSLCAWAYRELGIPAFDIEISTTLEKEALEKCRADLTDRSLLERYQKQHLGGIKTTLKKLAEQETSEPFLKKQSV